jgi:hypothetical protein
MAPLSGDEFARRAPVLLARLDEPRDPELDRHPYERLGDELGLEDEVVNGLIAENEALAELQWAAINRGEYERGVAIEADVAWDALREQDVRERAALARNPWRELACRETRTYGGPRWTTLLRLLRRNPVFVIVGSARQLRPRTSRSASRRRGARKAPSRLSEEPEPPTLAGGAP